jgi:hypothetical protein
MKAFDPREIKMWIAPLCKVGFRAWIISMPSGYIMPQTGQILSVGSALKGGFANFLT